ncbi:MAG: NYN domain-containing protein [Fischerella sp. CENA71]|nr:NYN domain-containing protein [Fischerella sp. CENA71]
MMVSPNLTQKALPSLPKSHGWLEKTQTVASIASVTGFLTGIFLQKVAYTLIPVTVYLSLQQFYRHKISEQIRQSQAKAFTVIEELQIAQDRITFLEAQMESMMASTKQFQQQSYSRHRLIISKLQEVSRKQFIFDRTVAPQMLVLQKCLSKLENETITDITSVQEEVTKLQATLCNIPAIGKIAQSDRQNKPIRVAAFIDEGNIYHSAKEQGFEIDYAGLLEELKGNAPQIDAYIYTGVDASKPKQREKLKHLQKLGYKPISKPVVRRANGSKKANLDVELALDLVELANQYDTVILVSGDGDLIDAVRRVQRQKVQVEVVSFRSVTAVSLMRVADKYTDLASLNKALQY